MTTRNDAAPGAFAEAARTTFIYAPIVSVIGVVLFAIGAVATTGFFTFMGVAAYVGAAVTALVGVAGMIREGQHLLARQHEAAGLAIAHYQRATVSSPGDGRHGGVGGQPAVAAVPQVAPYAAAGSAGSLAASSAPANTAPMPTAEAPVGPAVPSAAGSGADLSEVSATDAVDFVGLLKSLYILDAARDVQRLYGNETCASFVNRKCADNGMPHVHFTAQDIPENF